MRSAMIDRPQKLDHRVHGKPTHLAHELKGFGSYPWRIHIPTAQSLSRAAKIFCIREKKGR